MEIIQTILKFNHHKYIIYKNKTKTIAKTRSEDKKKWSKPTKVIKASYMYYYQSNIEFQVKTLLC